MWAEVDQHPLDNSARLVLIRNAERMQNTDRFIHWVKNRNYNPRTFLILVSNDEKVPRTEVSPAERKRGVKSEVIPHIAAIGSKGYVIECRPYTAATAQKAVQWVQSKVKMREGVAGHLLNRADGDLRLVRDVCTKLAAFPGEVTLTTVNTLLAERPRDSFCDALLALDKRTALMALAEMPEDEYSRTLGMLDSRLDLAGLIHDMQVEHRPQTEIARAAGAQGFLVKDLVVVAKHYDSKRRLAIRQILVTADEALKIGARRGVLEAVVVFW